MTSAAEKDAVTDLAARTSAALEPRRALIVPFVSVSILVIAGKGLGFVEKLALAHFEGASSAVDAYFAAFEITFVLFVLLDDVVGPALMALYVRLSETSGARAANRFLVRVCAGAAAVIGSLAVLLGLSPDLAIAGVAPGFDASTRDVAAGLLRWMLPAGLITALTALSGVALNARGVFAWPQAASLAHKIVLFAVMIVLLPRIGIAGAAFGTLAAAIVQGLIHAGAIRRWVFDGSGPAAGVRPDAVWRRFFILLAPLALGTVAARATSLVDTAFASGFEKGTLSALAYARRLVDLPILLIPGVLAVVAFPRLASLAARSHGEMLKLGGRLAALCVAAFVPMTIVAILDAEPMIGVVFGHGRFDAGAVEATAVAFRVFAAGLVFFAVEIVLMRVFYADLDTHSPFIVGLGCVAVNLLLTMSLVPVIGATAIPLSLVVQKALKSLVMLAILCRRHPGDWRIALARAAVRVMLCSFAFGAAYWAARSACAHTLASTRLWTACGILGSSTVAAAAYLVALAKTGAAGDLGLDRGWRELREAAAAMRRRRRHAVRRPGFPPPDVDQKRS
jgi:putative peptidoglycan lipid II flippase